MSLIFNKVQHSNFLNLFVLALFYIFSLPLNAATICHREGGGEQTVTGTIASHKDHPLDTLGACDSTGTTDSGTVSDSGTVYKETGYIVTGCTTAKEDVCEAVYAADSGIVDSGVIAEATANVAACKATPDSSSLYIKTHDSGILPEKVTEELDTCDPATTVSPIPGTGSSKSGRLNWREMFED